MYGFSRSSIAFVLAVLVLVLAGCTPVMPVAQAPAGESAAEPVADAAAEAAPAPEAGKLTVVDVRSRPAPLEGGNGAAFLTVLNGLDVPVRLTSATGVVAANIELHETVNDNGVMKMEPHPEGFEIPAGGVLELKPGGKHVMLLGLVAPLETGDSFDLTLNFEGSDPIDVTVPVVDMMGAMSGMDPEMGGEMHGGEMDHGAMQGGDMPMAAETPTP